MQRARQTGPRANSRQIEYWEISRLRAGPKVRKHPEAQIERICTSIQRFGFLCPPLVSSSGEVIAGVARIEAARRLGYEELPVLIADGLTEVDLKAYRIADNRLAEMSSWDMDALKVEFETILEFDASFDLQFTGFDTAAIDLTLNPGSAPVPDPDDELPIPAAQPVSRVGDIWHLGAHRLACGDALKQETYDRLMDGDVARLAVSDPPWNVPINGHASGLGRVKHRDFVQASGEMSDSEFEAFLSQALDRITSVLCDGAMCAMFIDWRGVEKMLAAGRKLGLSLVNICVWNKTNAGMGSLYRSKHELMPLFKRGKVPHVNNVLLGATGRYRTNVFDYSGVNSFGAGRMEQLESHPTVKPVAMITDIIKDLTHRGDLILDSFVGSGTALIAAQNSGRRGRAIELDPIYVDLAIRRFRTRFGIEAVHGDMGLSFDEVAARRTGEGRSQTIVQTPRLRTRPASTSAGARKQ